MMVWIISILGVLALGGAAAAAHGKWGSMAPLDTDDPAPWVPGGVLTADDVRAARFSLAWRGYQQSQVDEFLARLAEQLRVEKPEPAAIVAAPEEKGTDSTVPVPAAADYKE